MPTKETRRFDCKDFDGNVYTVSETQDVLTDDATSAPHSNLPAGQLRLTDPSTLVDRIDERTFLIVASGTIIRMVDSSNDQN
jgi:hypothetical protein